MNRLFFLMILLSGNCARAQCTYTCSSYSVSPVTYSMYTGGGTVLNMMDDEVTTNLPLNFVFEYFCTPYNQVRICSNGFITFDFGNIPYAGTPYSQALPSPTVPNAVIAWNWNDLDPSVGGSITYTTIGTAPYQKFIVTYSAVPLWTPATTPSTLLNTGQIILHESTNLIEVHVGEAHNNGWLTHSEGIEDTSGTIGYVVPGRNGSLWTATQSSHLFAPYSTGQAPQLSGDTLLCEGMAASYATTTLSGAQGYYWSFPPGWISAGAGTTYSAVAGSPGQVSVAAIYTCGNSPPATLSVTVLPAPHLSITAAAPSTLCSNTIYTLTAAGASQYTLEPGSLWSSGIFTTQPASSTIYTLHGTSALGCHALQPLTASVLVKPSPTLTVNDGTVCAGDNFTLSPSGAITYSYSCAFQVVLMQSPGGYQFSVTGTGTNGCVSAPAISSVFVPPTPTFAIFPDRTLVCAGERITLTAGGATSYTWDVTHTNQPTVSVVPLVSTSYIVRGTDQFGCKGTGSLYVPLSPCLGAEEITAQVPVIYPNPAGEEVFFQTAASEGLVSLVSASGSVLMRQRLLPALTRVYVGHLPRGLYTVIMSSATSASTYRLLLE